MDSYWWNSNVYVCACISFNNNEKQWKIDEKMH